MSSPVPAMSLLHSTPLSSSTTISSTSSSPSFFSSLEDGSQEADAILARRNRRHRRRQQPRWSERDSNVDPAVADDLVRSNVVTGEMHICFANDNSWFQGNVMTQGNHHYKIIGRRLCSDETMNSFADLGNVDSGFESVGNSISNIDQVHNIHRHEEATGQLSPSTSLSSSSTGDCGSSLDSELILDRLGKDLSSLHVYDFVDGTTQNVVAVDINPESDRPDEYHVKIVDLDTGLDYLLERVHGVRRHSDCRLLADSRLVSSDCRGLSFKANKRFKGASADKVLVEQMGPAFVDRDLTVFRGQVSFVYQDRKCHAVSVNETKWCL